MVLQSMDRKVQLFFLGEDGFTLTYVNGKNACESASF